MKNAMGGALLPSMTNMVVRCLYDQLMPIAEIKKLFNPANTNKHGDDQIERLAKILNYQGARYPAKVSKRSGLLTAGHGRVLAAEKAGWDLYPVNFQEYDDETQELSDLTADNAIAAWAELDMAKINAQLENLGPDFDIDMLGIRGFVLDMSEKIAAINRGDEMSEWVDMPDFKPGDKDIKLTIIFTTELEREQFATNHSLEITTKNANQWTVRR